MHIGWFMGFAWDVGNPITFKVLQCHSNPKKRAQILHRGAIVPHSIEVSGYNSALQPKIDAYFPSVQSEGGGSSETSPSAHQGTVDPPDNVIPEGGGKRRKLSSTPSGQLRMGRYTADSAEAVV